MQSSILASSPGLVPYKLTAGLIRSLPFDVGFVGGIAAVALISGWAVTVWPFLFGPILALDLWLIGYQHVIATYTRLCFDQESLREHRFLLFGLPIIVVAGVAVLIASLGVWALISLYFYWQWFHYTRQSWGISQVYSRKSGHPEGSKWLTHAAFYLPPLWGLLYRSHQGFESFLDLPLRSLPVPAIFVNLVGAAAAGALIIWLVQRFLAWRRGALAVGHTAYVLSHHSIFFAAYGIISEIEIGWLVVNIWHNAQYVLFVWLFNTNRFRDGVSARATFLSKISQPSRAWVYFAVCLGISTVIYLSFATMLPVGIALAVYMIINFHHYIVDSVIWKVRKRSLREVLGLT